VQQGHPVSQTPFNGPSMTAFIEMSDLHEMMADGVGWLDSWAKANGASDFLPSTRTYDQPPSGLHLYLHQFTRLSRRSGGNDEITSWGHAVALRHLPDWSDRINDSRASWIGHEPR
jgi:hypothetical protein